MSKSTEREEKIAELIKKLLEQKFISAPQAEIAKSDAEVTGMGIDEVLIARRWVQEETIARLVPGLYAKSTDAGKESASAAAEPPVDNRASDWQSSDDFEDNLQKYRDLMETILGESDK